MEISVSLMCADQLELMRNIISLIKLDIDYLHFDVMDGTFVNNLALNLDIIKKTRQLTGLPFDIHLMVQKPSQYFGTLIENGADIIIFHVETSEDIQKNIDYLKSKNIKAGLALNLETRITDIEKYLGSIDYILIMTAKTGFSGAGFVEDIFEKINSIYSYIQEKGFKTKIMVDGGIKIEHVPKLYENGADIIVAGTSLLFNNNGLSNNLEEFEKTTSNLPQRKIRPTEQKSSETTYSALVLRDINKLEIIKRVLGPLKKGEVVVKIMSCGICGSDLIRIYRKGMYSKNLVPGHEFAGLVIKTKESNKEFLNRRVVIYPLIPCNECFYCKLKKFNLCENYNYLGSRSDGGFAELCIVPQNNLISLPNSITYDEATLIEPMAVALRGVRKMPNIINSNVLILGLGSVGILSGMLCKKLGSRKVFGIDRNRHKCEIAKLCGFENCSGELSFDNNDINIIIECSGSNELINSNINSLKKEGTILLLANYENDLRLSPSTMSKILRTELKVLSSWNSIIGDSDNNDWESCISYLANKEFDVSQLITHRFPLQKIIDIFDKMNKKELKYLKIVINPN